MKNLEPRAGFLNRNLDGLPPIGCNIEVLIKDADGEHVYICEWVPFDRSKYSVENMPADGYLGTAEVIMGQYKGIGFHAWAQNNSEFIFYNIYN